MLTHIMWNIVESHYCFATDWRLRQDVKVKILSFSRKAFLNQIKNALNTKLLQKKYLEKMIYSKPYWHEI